MLSVAILKELVLYEPESGVAVWRPRPDRMFNAAGQAKYWNEKNAGCLAFRPDKRDGYRTAQILGKNYRAHKLVFFYMTGKWPAGQVDHIDGNRANNAWSNLRVVSHTENMRNRKLFATNTSGFHGVYWHAEHQAWASQIEVEGVRKHLGYFYCKNEAAAARRGAEIVLGFHKNHGRPA